MPRYFFNVLWGRLRIDDPQGTELPDLDAARLEAAKDARAFMSSDAGRGIDRSRSAAIEVADENGQVLLTFPFREAIQVVD